MLPSVGLHPLVAVVVGVWCSLETAATDTAAFDTAQVPDLTSFLNATLLGADSGAIVVSSPTSPVTNVVTLQITNTAPLPLYRGKKLWTTNAAIGTVRFTYCNRVSLNCLTCDCCQDCGNEETAWNIVGSIHTPMYSEWNIAGSGSTDPDPTW